ncbi:hypothetical protein BS47DRAFT_1381537 [Hydnum rufescens UP504]|uniref:Cysteine-rich transmembrane CYSTM domain-containing protein n=1 Tax=Hydnum rufescens UP504 TaxID=1448309 RepID=A0A9P6B0D4_9AGAM|nr:hypothetical protein BS47DRAFT_1381537 [Hydnum rufescens UP504]
MLSFFTSTQQPNETAQMQQPAANKQMALPAQGDALAPEDRQKPLRLRGGGNFIKDCLICICCCCALEDICCCELEALCGCCNSLPQSYHCRKARSFCFPVRRGGGK